MGRPSTNENLFGIASGNNSSVTVGGSGSILRSTDNGSSWGTISNSVNSNLNGLDFGNNIYLAGV